MGVGAGKEKKYTLICLKEGKAKDYEAERNKRGKFDVNLAETLKAMHSNVKWRTPRSCVTPTTDDDTTTGNNQQPAHIMLKQDKNSFVYRLNDLLIEVVNGVIEIGDPLDLSHGG